MYFALQPEAYCVKFCERCSSSELSTFSTSIQCVTFLSLLSSSCHLLPMPTESSCTVQSCCSCTSSYMSSLHPRSLAQLSSRGPARGLSFSIPLVFLQMSLGLCRKTLRKILKESLMFPPSAVLRFSFPGASFLLSETVWQEGHLPLSQHRQDTWAV